MTGLMAAQKGVPFVPMRGLIGTDLLARRPDWRVIDNPVKRGTEPDPIALIPAIDVDVAFFHVPLADVHGNVWIGRRRELASMAYAARITLVTAERISTESLLTNERDAAGVLPALYVSSVALAPSGSLPYGVWGEYASDAAAIAQYARAAATQQGFDAYVDAQLAARGLLAAVTA
jgi:glutaconate CoA-transferase subunit A